MHGELETNLIKLPEPTRKLWTAQLREAGFKPKEIAPITNVTRMTVHRDSGGESNSTKQPEPNAATPQTETEVIRAWAKAQGLPVKDRGRLPADVMAEYEAANPGADAPADDDEITDAEIVDVGGQTPGEKISKAATDAISHLQQLIEDATPGECTTLAGELGALRDMAAEKSRHTW